jgi:hypothetical protein
VEGEIKCGVSVIVLFYFNNTTYNCYYIWQLEIEACGIYGLKTRHNNIWSHVKGLGKEVIINEWFTSYCNVKCQPNKNHSIVVSSLL